jgi:REP element-mobilizing transposase RayT/DNA-binding CsgD family transcriptional regulator
MSRILREQRPGGVFHITARTQGQAHWFKDGLHPRIEQYIVDGVRTAGNYLIAHAVMDNHLHVVFAQGRRSLGFTMQPILRRIALLVKLKYQVEDHVFGRRFASKPCENADHLRCAILYTHFNPVKAGLCSDVAAYAWTSHRALASIGDATHVAPTDNEILRLFCAHDYQANDASLARECYLAHVAWWQRKLEAQLADLPFNEVPPDATSGDKYFDERFGAPDLTLLRPAIDLRDRARRLAALFAADCDVDLLRRAYGSPQLIQIRNRIIAALLTDGYRTSAIATYFRVSPATVSLLGSRLRWQEGKFR